MDAALPNTARSTRSWRGEGFPHHRRRLGHPCRPQTGYYADIIEEAAALWESLPQGHPFIDGNKRTALAASHIFLAINGIELHASAAEMYTFITALYDTDTFRFPALVIWLRRNTRPLT
jgi:death-on-curing protein